MTYDPNATRSQIGAISLTEFRYSDGMRSYAIAHEGLDDQELVDSLWCAYENARNFSGGGPRETPLVGHALSACRGTS